MLDPIFLTNYLLQTKLSLIGSMSIKTQQIMWNLCESKSIDQLKLTVYLYPLQEPRVFTIPV